MIQSKDGFYQKIFSENQIKEAKRRTEQKNKLLQYNNLTNNSDNRYVGLLGEWGFYYFLRDLGFQKTDFKFFNNDHEIDKLDCEVKNLKVDVKTKGRNYDPELNYACDIDEHQYAKLYREDCPVNTFVFGSYNIKTGKFFLLGWLTKEDFRAKAKYYKKGDILNTLTVDTPLYEVLISDLNPVSSLFAEGKDYKKIWEDMGSPADFTPDDMKFIDAS